jgi:hypothetical protein
VRSTQARCESVSGVLGESPAVGAGAAADDGDEPEAAGTEQPSTSAADNAAAILGVCMIEYTTAVTGHGV